MKLTIIILIVLTIFFGCKSDKIDCLSEDFIASRNYILEELRNNIIGFRNKHVIMGICLSQREEVIFGFDIDSLIKFNRFNLNNSLSSEEKYLLSKSIFNNVTIKEIENELKKYALKKIKLLYKYDISSVNSNTYRSPLEVFVFCNDITVYHITKELTTLTPAEKKVLTNTEQFQKNWYIIKRE